MAKATLGQILDKAANVVEAQIALDLATKAGSETKQYSDALASTVYQLRWIVERDRKQFIRQFKDADLDTVEAEKQIAQQTRTEDWHDRVDRVVGTYEGGTKYEARTK